MKTNMILLLNGLSRGGKDTVANHLSNVFDFSHIKISTHLKNCVSQMFDIPIEHLENDQKDVIIKKYNKTPRDILKYVGTDFGQFHMEELLPGTNRCFWVNKMIYDMKENAHRNFVISDYRFAHEHAALQNAFPLHALYVLQIVPNFVGSIPPSAHVSETPLPADYTIYNEDINKLKNDVNEIITWISLSHINNLKI